MADGVADVLLAVLEGWSCVQSWEGFDGVVEVSVALVEGHSKIQLFRAHYQQ